MLCAWRVRRDERDVEWVLLLRAYALHGHETQEGRQVPGVDIRVPAAPANRTVLPDGFFLAPTSNRSLCARAQPNFGAALLLPDDGS